MSIFANYYRQDIEKLLSQLVPADAKSKKVFESPHKLKGRHDYIILPNSLSHVDDIQNFIGSLKKNCHAKTRIVVIYFSFLWKPFLDLATTLSLRQNDNREPNWLSSQDITNLFTLEDFELVKEGKRFLFPIPLGPVSEFINRYFANLPIINSLCLTIYQIYRPRQQAQHYTVSVIIPVRNEQGNIKGMLAKIPNLGKGIEVIFVEGHSKDNSYQAILSEISHARGEIKAQVFKQKGQGKGDAVRLGFDKAKNDILMILDADLTVNPKDLVKFYKVLSQGHGEFANGSRLVYPLEEQAMRTANYLGNKFFSATFTFLLGQRIKDTLCGTKVLFRDDYLKIAKNRKYFGDFDPFGDFDLLFGATKLNLKIVEIPVRYRQRRYGTTNISRFKHGLLLLKMTFFAARKLKFV